MTTAILTAVGVGHIDGNATTTVGSGRTGFLPTGFFSTPQTNRAWLLFDTWHIPSDAVVSAASLDLTVNSNFLGAGDGHTLNLYRLRRRGWKGAGDGTGATAGWPNNAASWANYQQTAGLAWTTAGAGDTTNDRESAVIGSLACTNATSGTKTIALDTTKVQEWLSGAFVNNGLLLQASVETGSTLMRWQTINHATASFRPRLSITYTSAAEAKALTDNVVAHYRLGDTSDASGNGHTLTNTNGVTFVTGKVGNAAHFVAASSQRLTNNDVALKPGATQDWTCVFWAKLTDLSDFYTAVSQWNTASGAVGGGGWRVFYHKQSILDYYVAQLNDAAGSAEVADVIGYTSGALGSAGTWIMICIRHDATRRNLHLGFNDQMAKANSSASHNSGEGWGPYLATYLPVSDPFAIGAESNGSGGFTQPFNGDIDQLTFWNRWLTDTEVTTLYNAGAGTDLTFGSVSSGRLTLLGVG